MLSALSPTIAFHRSPRSPSTLARRRTSVWKTMSTTLHTCPALSFSSRTAGETRCGMLQLCPIRPLAGSRTSVQLGGSMSSCEHTLMKTLPISRSKSFFPGGRSHAFSANPLSGLSSS